MKIIPSYKHVFEKPDLCGPACLEMILIRKGILGIDQEKIAKELDARILPKNAQYILTILKISKKIPGIDLIEFKQKKLTDFLKKYNIPLQAQVFFLREVQNFTSFITGRLQKNNDIMVNFHTRIFNKGTNFGHFALVSEIDNNTLTICDPEKRHGKFWKTSVEDLTKAMERTIDGKERGLVVFSKLATRSFE